MQRGDELFVQRAKRRQPAGTRRRRRRGHLVTSRTEPRGASSAQTLCLISRHVVLSPALSGPTADASLKRGCQPIGAVETFIGARRQRPSRRLRFTGRSIA